MKIALCLFGNLRTFDLCAESLNRHIAQPNNCDVFIHTWSKLNHETVTWHNNSPNAHNPRVDDSVTISRIKGLFSPKSLLIEDPILDSSLGCITSAGRPISILGIHTMISSMEKANSLRKAYEASNNISYDYVIFTRPDILFNSDLRVSEIVNEISKVKSSEQETQSTIFTACHLIGHSLVLEKINCLDLLFFAKPKVLDVFFSSKAYFFNKFSDGMSYLLGPEYYFIKTFSELGNSITLLNYFYDRDFRIIRLESQNPSKFKLKYKFRALKSLVKRGFQ